LVQFSRVITASKEPMSGRPALSFCLTWIGYQVVHEVQLAGLLAAHGNSGDREDAAVDTHVADLGLVRDAARAR
jgi:hypothetical protein